MSFGSSITGSSSADRDMMSDTDPIIGKKLGDYIIVDILGQGGMARVYRGMDKKLNRYAAVKVIDAHLIREDQEEYRQRFQNEARAIARLNHPNIVGIYQFDQVGTIYYMAMSFIEGKDLRTVLRNHAHNGTRMSYREIADVIYDIGSALDYAHSEGVIHRDIKPSNIMLSTTNHRAILTDFGLALSVREGTIGNTFGSAHYIAPEQAVSSAQAVPQSDIYSLGIVLFEMLTNRVPFNDPSAMAVAMKHLNDPPPPPSRINPNIPPKLDQIVLRALDKDPKKRYPTAIAMAQALEEAITQFGGEIPESDSQIKPLPSWGDTASSVSRPNRLASSSQRPELTGARKDLLASWDTNDQTATPRKSFLDNSPTITDSRASAATRRQLMEDVPRQSTRRLWLIGAIALVGVLALFAAIVIATNPNLITHSGDATPTLDQTVAVAALPTIAPTGLPAIGGEASDTPASVASIASELSATPGSEGTQADFSSIFAASTPGTATPVSATSATATITDTPGAEVETAESAPEVTTNPSAAAVDANAPVLLKYDGQSLELLNRSKLNVDVSNLTFVQIAADGSKLDFESKRWDGGNRPTSALPPGDCYEVMQDQSSVLPKPGDCTNRQAWSQVSYLHWFWISTNSTAIFIVKRGDQTLATCPISAGECAFDPAGD